MKNQDTPEYGEPHPIYEEMAAIIGQDATLKIANEVGGLLVYIPASADKLKIDHWLIRTIGIDLARKLCDGMTAGVGASFLLPLGPARRTHRLDGLILSGAPLREIAQRAGVCWSTVVKRKRRLRDLGILPPRSSSNERQKP